MASRGLDIPSVDWIVQFDPPDEVDEYIHRVGRTCRRSGQRGQALLLLTESEKKFLGYLQKEGIIMNQFESPESQLIDIQSQFQNLVQNNYFLNQGARSAYKSFLYSYLSHSLKDVFDVQKLDLIEVGKSFGLVAPPKVDLTMSFKRKRYRQRNFLSPKFKDSR